MPVTCYLVYLTAEFHNFWCMAMMTSQTRQTETYDPRQRLVGGVILVVLMLLLYAVLKAVLGISSSGAAHVLTRALEQNEEVMLRHGGATTGEIQQARGDSPQYPIIEGFVFLGLDGNPLRPGEHPRLTNVSMPGEPAGETRWVVQAGSFKERERAERFVEQLGDKDIQAGIFRSGDWYAVRMPPQTNRRVAEQQLLELRQKTRQKGMILKLE